MIPLPRLACRFRDLDQQDWEPIAPVFLRDAVSGDPPKQATWFKTTWDSLELHVLFHAEDIDAWAALTERDAPLYEEEVVEIFLDPVGDLESYFEIEVNPLGAVCDLVLRRTRSGYRKSFAWDCDRLRAIVKKEAGCWTAGISIPFASLGPDLPRLGHPWRVNFFRIDRPKNAPRELSAWSPTGQRTFHIQEKFGILDFIRA